MEYRIILTAASKEELNKLIDGMLKKGYLLEHDMYAEEPEKWSQAMTQPRNMEAEVTPLAVLKLIVIITSMIGILYYTK